jgi:ligand-binding sensor domain-containing protein
LNDYVTDEKSFTNFLLDETPNCILQNKNGNIFIGSFRGGGVYRYNPLALLNAAKKNEEGFTKINGFHDGMINCMVEDKVGNIWVGTRNSAVDCYDGKYMINFSEKDGLTKNGIFCIFEDSKGILWLGSNALQNSIRGDAFCYDGKSFTNVTAKIGITRVDGFVYDVRSIIEDKLGNIWIGSKNGLLLCYDGKKFIDFSEKLLR